MIRKFFKFMGALFLLALVLSVAQSAGMKESYNPLLVIAFFVGYWLLRKRKKSTGGTQQKDAPALPLTTTPNPNGAVFVLDGVNDTLEAFADKVTITPKRNAASILIRGMKGSKSIPYTSITAIQFREANPINGYIQFSILGGVESGGGFMAAIGDENSCFFVEKSNTLAREIKDYIESRMAEIRIPKTTPVASISDEVQKLAALNAQGILSDEEFTAAKKRLVG